MANKVGFKELEKYALNNQEIVNRSGQQELLEGILTQYLIGDN